MIREFFEIWDIFYHFSSKSEVFIIIGFNDLQLKAVIKLREVLSSCGKSLFI